MNENELSEDDKKILKYISEKPDFFNLLDIYTNIATILGVLIGKNIISETDFLETKKIISKKIEKALLNCLSDVDKKELLKKIENEEEK